MSAPGERASLLRRLRASLEELAADGVDRVPRAAVRETMPAAPPPAPLVPEPELRAAPPATLSLLGAALPDATVPGDPAAGLRAIRAELGDCRRCRLCEGRKNIVFGEGSPEARVVFVGEGPGQTEDETGRPFVGRAGELLTKMIEAVGWTREQVYICNIVKCRPPGNRDPQLDEVAACRGFLDKQLGTIRPIAIVALGKPATSTLLGRPVAITKARGLWHEWNGIPVMPTYHPAYLLRNYTRETRQAVWDDLRAVRARIDGNADN
jgi:uracil-DNA glycosylase